MLRDLHGLIVLDEVQELPELFRLLRVLADRPRTPARFLVLGSASPDLLRQTSESLAGRIAFHDLDGLHYSELRNVRGFSVDRLWLRGGFPPSYLARNDESSLRWRLDFVRTFLQAVRRRAPLRAWRRVGRAPDPTQATRARRPGRTAERSLQQRTLRNPGTQETRA